MLVQAIMAKIKAISGYGHIAFMEKWVKMSTGKPSKKHAPSYGLLQDSKKNWLVLRLFDMPGIFNHVRRTVR
jgi:hypothetical protein